jgi:hypothetical protein
MHEVVPAETEALIEEIAPPALGGPIAAVVDRPGRSSCGGPLLHPCTLPRSDDDEVILRLTSAPWELQAMDLTVRAAWDAQASVWVAESDDVPGLITEADDLEALMTKLRIMIPEFRLIVLDRAHRLAA